MASSGSLSLLASDLQQLAAETKRKHADIKEAAERSLLLIKTNPEQVAAALKAEVPPPTSQVEDVLKPLMAACGTKNVKVVAIALGSLQRLIGMGAIPRTKIPSIVQMLSTVVPLGVEIQLRVLQTLPSLLMQFPLQVHDDLLSEVLFLCFRLQDSRVGVVSSTAAATLRQLVMLVFDGVVDEDRAVSESKEAGRPLDRRRQETDFVVNVPAVQAAVNLSGEGEGSGEKRVHLRPGAKDGYLLFEDLCLLVNGEPGAFLKLQSLPKTFGLELIESVMTGHGKLFQKHPELIYVLRARLCPFLIRALSDKPTFALTLRLTRVAFLLLKQFADELYAETEVFLTILIRMVSVSLDVDVFAAPTADSPPWLRILALEIFRGLTADFDLLIRIFDRYDARSRDRGTALFTGMMGAFNRLASERPQLLGVNSEISFGAPSAAGQAASVGVQGVIDGVVGMATHAAAPLVTAQHGSLAAASAQMKLQCIDQLDKAEAPAIPETYGYLLALQCLSNVSEGFASVTLNLFRDIVRQHPKQSKDGTTYAPGPVDWQSIPSAPRFAPLQSIRGMADASWPALLASLSFFLTVNLDESLFADTLRAIQSFASVCGVLGLDTPRDAFLSGLCKFAIPPPIVAGAASTEQITTPAKPSQSVLSVDSLGLGGGGSAAANTLGPRNFACLRALLGVAQTLSGSLNAAWYIVFEALQNMDHVLGARRRRRTTTTTPAMTPAVSAEQEDAAVQASIQKLFEHSKLLDDKALQHFIAALCRLSSEMVGFQDVEAVTGSAKEFSPLETPRSIGPAERRRQSGLNASKTLRQAQTSFSVSKLGSVAMLNMARLVAADQSVGWHAITTHLLEIQRSGEAESSIRLQATDVLDQILLAASRVDVKGDAIVQQKVQAQIVDAVARQAEAEMRPQMSADVEVRKRAFETLYKILEAGGHAFVAGWRHILDVLRTACPSPLALTAGPSPLREGEDPSYFPSMTGYVSKNPVLVRTAFPALHLICTDFLAALDLEELRHCITVLAEFGGQVDDINIALTAEGLLWQVSDHLQAQRQRDNGQDYVELWMFLLSSLLNLCRSPRQEIRDGAIQTLFRTLGVYAASLPEPMWERLVADVIFALLRHLSAAIATSPSAVPTGDDAPSMETARQPNGVPLPLASKQLDDSKELAIESTARVFRENLASATFRSSRLSAACADLLAHLRDAFVNDRPQVQVAAAKAMRTILQADFGAATPADRAPLWNTAWQAFIAMGRAIGVPPSKSPKVAGPASTYWTQASLEALVSVIGPLLDPTLFDVSLARVQELLDICLSILVYSGSPDYRQDIDHLSPLQKAVLDLVSGLPLGAVAGVPSVMLSFLARVGSLAFDAPFDAPDVGPVRGPRYGVTYIGVCKSSLPELAVIYERFRDDPAIYLDGAVDRMFAAYATPMRLKYSCPPSSRHGSDQPLWKTATEEFVGVARACMARIASVGEGLPSGVFVSVWTHIVSAIRGALLADCSAATAFDIVKQREEENFDLTLLAFLETDVLPALGAPGVPDDVIDAVLDALVSACQVYQPLDSSLYSFRHEVAESSASLVKETHFSNAPFLGSTITVGERPRERFSYWCLDLLFISCHARPGHAKTLPAQQRVAFLALGKLMQRCRSSIDAYVADAPLRGRSPMPRVREEELVHILRRLLELRLWPRSPDHAAATPAETLLGTRVGHLSQLYPSFLAVLGLPSAQLPPTMLNSLDAPYAPSRDAFRPASQRQATVGSPSPLADLADEPWDPHALALRCMEVVGREAGFVR